MRKEFMIISRSDRTCFIILCLINTETKGTGLLQNLLYVNYILTALFGMPILYGVEPIPLEGYTQKAHETSTQHLDKCYQI